MFLLTFFSKRMAKKYILNQLRCFVIYISLQKICTKLTNKNVFINNEYHT